MFKGLIQNCCPFFTGEQHISEPKYRYGDQHCARTSDDFKGESGKNYPEFSQKHNIISLIINLICLLWVRLFVKAEVSGQIQGDDTKTHVERTWNIYDSYWPIMESLKCARS